MGIFENAGLLTKEAEAVRHLRDNLKDLGLLDDDNLAIAIESETSLKEVVEDLLKEELEAKADIDKMKAMVKTLNDRRASYEKRCETVRKLLLVAFEQAEIKTAMRTAFGTVSLKKCPMGVEVIEGREGELPSEYWKLPDPVVDKAKLKAAAIAREKAILDARAQAGDDAKLLKQLLKKIDAEHPAIPGVEIIPESNTISVRT